MGRITKGVGKASTQFKGTGTDYAKTPISIKFDKITDIVLRQIPDKSAKIREWVLEGLKKEGYL